MSIRKYFLIPLVLLFASGCPSMQPRELTLLPITQKAQAIHIAYQQRVISGAIDDAIEREGFANWAGQSAYVEINGVFPHSHEDVLEYIRTRVEAKLSTDGVIVREYKPERTYAESGRIIQESKLAPPETEWRVVVNVAECGADEIKKTMIGKQPVYVYKGVCKLWVHIIPRIQEKGSGESKMLVGQKTQMYMEDFYMYNTLRETGKSTENNQ